MIGNFIERSRLYMNKGKLVILILIPLIAVTNGRIRSTQLGVHVKKKKFKKSRVPTNADTSEDNSSHSSSIKKYKTKSKVHGRSTVLSSTSERSSCEEITHLQVTTNAAHELRELCPLCNQRMFFHREHIICMMERRRADF